MILYKKLLKNNFQSIPKQQNFIKNYISQKKAKYIYQIYIPMIQKAVFCHRWANVLPRQAPQLYIK
jgi:hypothetical protein